MNEAEFWRIMEKSKVSSKSSDEKQVELLIEYLSQLSEGEILDFDYIHEKFMEEAFERNLWNAAEIIGGGCGDDGFTDFRAWLIAQGQDVYGKALVEPESLAEYIELGQETQVQDLAYVAMQAYEIKTGIDGSEMPCATAGKRPLLKGEWTRPEEIAAKYPKLYAKFTPYWEDSSNWI